MVVDTQFHKFYDRSIARVLYLVLMKHSYFTKKLKTSAVSTTNWMVETQLCKLRDTSDTFVGRAYSIINLSWGARANRAFFSLVFQGKKSLFVTVRTSIGCQKKKIKHYSVPGMFVCVGVCVWFNIVIGHLGRLYSTHTAPMPVLTGSVHAHILTKPSRAGFAVIRLELIEPGAATCV